MRKQRWFSVSAIRTRSFWTVLLCISVFFRGSKSEAETVTISIDRSKLNVTGSSLAAGHPFAATGGRIVATLAKMLHEKGPGSRGLISICAAGGQGVTAILER